MVKNEHGIKSIHQIPTESPMCVYVPRDPLSPLCLTTRYRLLPSPHWGPRGQEPAMVMFWALSICSVDEGMQDPMNKAAAATTPGA